MGKRPLARGWWRASAVLAIALMLPLSSLAAQGEGELVPGDLIRLSGTRETELPGDYPVDETGTVVLPLLGARRVTGVAAGELKDQLRAAYRQQLRNQEVQIALLRRVRVLGAVKNPGIYHVDPTMSVADAIALAGGATDEGKLSTVRIVRAGKTVRANVDRDAPVAGGLRSGDQIMVPERSWMSRNGKFVVGGLLSAVGIVVAASIR
jgi:protein involved in polysaccharide export with SLBB domain